MGSATRPGRSSPFIPSRPGAAQPAEGSLRVLSEILGFTLYMDKKADNSCCRVAEAWLD